MTALIEAALSHSRTVIASLLLLLIAGVYSYVAIPKESDPDVSIPIIYVSMSLDGVSPEDAERLMVRPMEEELRSVEGVKEMTASAYEGGANVMLEFDAGFDVDQALIDVREKVDRVRPDLPDEADEPVVSEVNVSLFPVLVVTLWGEVPERTLLRLARDLGDRVEALPAVLSVDIAGDREEAVEVVIDPMLVESYGLDSGDITALIDRSNRLVAAGALDTGDGRFAVKVPGLIEDINDILYMPVKVDGDAVVRFRDIAEVRRSFKDRESFARVNGHPAVALEITKRTGENIIDTIARVRSIVEEESRQWPDAINVTYSQDRSEDIRIMLSDLQNNVVSAILLIMILIVGALGLRSGLLVGIAIPGSFLTGILLLFTLGFTVNIVVLFALILAVGMLVDGAIVVTEYADRKMAEGLDRRQAYGLAAKRMAWPITSSTATTLAAFLPLLFWPGVVGEFMKFLPLTLIATLAASLSMALIFVPTLGAWFGKPGDIDPARMRALAAGETGDVRETGGLTGAYVKLLDGAIRRAGLVMTAAVVALFGIWAYYVVNGNGVEFFPAVEPEQAIILVHARGNLSVGEEDALVREVENEVLALSGEFASVYTRTGAAGQGQDVGEDVIGQIQIELTDWDQRRPASEILADIRERTAGLAGIRVEAREPEAGPPVGKAIQVQLTSRLPELLPEAADKIRAKLESMPGLIDIEDSLSSPGVEWELQIDRAHAARFGLDVTAVGQAVKLVTNGLVIGAYRPDDTDDEIDLVVRYPEQYRSIEQLDNIRLMTDAGGVPISNFIERTAQPKVGTIDRVEARRAVTVSADVLPDVLPAEKVEQIRAWLADAGLDGRVDVQFRGEDEEQQAAMQFLGKAFAVALFLIAIILLTQFNSFYSAALILSAVVMSTVGVLIGLIVTGQPFGIVMTGIGVIALAGIVVNNNIVLIDTFDRLVASGHDVREAILRTGAQRLRPVMLTTITTILGLMPMTLSTNIDFVNRAVSVGAPSTQWWVGLSTAIVFGLTFATVLTLIVTPSALMLRAEVHAWRMRRRERPQSRPAGDEERYARAAE